ncbi:MAG TPA: family 1 glycosylhydrolase [Acidimicrobiales bacterium]|jgi:beta-glucosidase/6-phospho-beta-glucosidase/beta-galactosidase|nr:family 1 glycosylhydrolase [Acidimicrobiales bacterium]
MVRRYGRPTIEFIGGFESTYQPAFDVDGTEINGHAARWRADLELLLACGVTRARYPVRWHRIETRRGTYDWAATDEVLGWMADHGMRPIPDLLHHTSHPRWLKRGFADRRFAGAYLRYVEAFARRYPWVEAYTLCNEPFTTFLLCGEMGVWPPYSHGLKGFLTLAANVMPALTEASGALRDLLPQARHFYVDTCERASAATPAAQAVADRANDRRFFVLDLFLGRHLDPARPFVAEVLAAGGERLLGLQPGHVDVLGLDYYAHNQWRYVDGSGRGMPTSSDPGSLADLIVEYWDRYALPCAIGETNIRGFAPDRASWLKYTLEQCEAAVSRGVALDGYCWFPFVDSCDWSSLLARSDGHVDPVGVYWLDDGLDRRPSSMSAAYAAAAGGAPAAALPAYRFQPPVAGWLAGWLPQMAHWDWQDPPEQEVSMQARADGTVRRRIAEQGP